MAGSLLDEFRSIPDFYPGTNKPIVRHPNRRPEDPPDLERWDAKPRMLPIAGVLTELFTVGHLARALNRRPVTIRAWERDHIIPKPTIWKRSQDERGNRRLYSRGQVEGLIKIAEEEGLLKGDYRAIKDTEFTKRAFELWKELASK